MDVNWLKNKQNEKFYPITNSKAVISGDNTKTTVFEDLIDIKNKLNDKSATSIKDFNNPDKYLEFTTDTGVSDRSDLMLLGADKANPSTIALFPNDYLIIDWENVTNKPSLYSQKQVDEKVSNVILFQPTEPTSQTIGGVWCKTTNLT